MPNVFTTDRLSSLLRYSRELSSLINEGSILKIIPVGSFETTTVENQVNDLDLLILVNSEVEDIEIVSRLLRREGWETSLGSNNQERFLSFKKTMPGFMDIPVNLILTNNEDFYNRFEVAANVCKALNLTNKNQRILVHDIFMESRVQKIIDEVYIRD